MEHKTDAERRSTQGAAGRPSPVDRDGYAAGVIRHWARRLVRELRLPSSDGADIEQDLWLDLIVRWPRYDVDRAGPKTFASRVVERRAATLRQNLRKQAGRRMRRLPAESTPRSDDNHTRGEAEPTAATAALLAPVAPETGLSDDVASVVTRLPMALGDLCRRLMDDDVSAVARQLGVSRTAIYRRLRLARRQFVAAEVHEYLHSARTL